jgi:hypothetical protein
MKTIEQAGAILAAAHKNMPADMVALHALALAGVVASLDLTVATLCQTIADLTGEPPAFTSVEVSWPGVYDAGTAANG